MAFFNLLFNYLLKFLPHLVLRLVIASFALYYGFNKYYSSSPFVEQDLIPFEYFLPELVKPFLIWWPIIGGVFLILGFKVRIVIVGLMLIVGSILFSNFPFNLQDIMNIWQSSIAIYMLIFSYLLVLFLIGAGSLSVDNIVYNISNKNETLNTKKEKLGFINKDTQKIKINIGDLKKRPSKLIMKTPINQ